MFSKAEEYIEMVGDIEDLVEGRASGGCEYLLEKKQSAREFLQTLTEAEKEQVGPEWLAIGENLCK